MQERGRGRELVLPLGARRDSGMFPLDGDRAIAPGRFGDSQCAR
jgi:hypothetical protein